MISFPLCSELKGQDDLRFEKLFQLQENSAKLINELAKAQEQTAKDLRSVEEAQEKAAKAQEQTAKDLSELSRSVEEAQKQTAKDLSDLSKRVKDLIGYNSNRDEELEVLFENKLLDFLEDQGWEVTKIRNVDNIYDSNGVVLTELDGIIFGTHKSYPEIGFYFFLEAKQIFSLKKYRENFLTKIPILQKTLDELPGYKLSKNPFYSEMCNKLYRYRRLCTTHRVVGVLGSPCIEASLKKQLITDQTSSITFSSDQYIVKLFVQ
jgi:DNA-binding protein H-NS